jgi:hypothetical protein
MVSLKCGRLSNDWTILKGGWPGYESWIWEVPFNAQWYIVPLTPLTFLLSFPFSSSIGSFARMDLKGHFEMWRKRMNLFCTQDHCIILLGGHEGHFEMLRKTINWYCIQGSRVIRNTASSSSELFHLLV